MSSIETLLDVTVEIQEELTAVREDLREIRERLPKPPTYIVLDDPENKEAVKSLLKKICRPHKPGGIIRLTNKELSIYRGMLTCPPSRR